MEKTRKIRFWAGESVTGTKVTAMNKKLLREAIASKTEDNFKGTKIRMLEVPYSTHADLAATLLGSSVDSLLISGQASVISEYDA